ncbi:unnamed protein product [Laminaria digitata]
MLLFPQLFLGASCIGRWLLGFACCRWWLSGDRGWGQMLSDRSSCCGSMYRWQAFFLNGFIRIRADNKLKGGGNSCEGGDPLLACWMAGFLASGCACGVVRAVMRCVLTGLLTSECAGGVVAACWRCSLLFVCFCLFYLTLVTSDDEWKKGGRGNEVCFVALL